MATQAWFALGAVLTELALELRLLSALVLEMTVHGGPVAEPATAGAQRGPGVPAGHIVLVRRVADQRVSLIPEYRCDGKL